MFPTNLTSQFSFEAMRQLLLASAAAYSKPSEAEAMARAAGATEFYWIADERTSTQGFIAANSTDVVVLFCGTKIQSARDWMTDAHFLLSRDADFPGRVHAGFGTAYGTVRMFVLDTVERLQVCRRVWIGGHSLGGALAMLCAYDLVRGGITLAGIYTFGQPRVGDSGFVAAYDGNSILRERTFRIVNGEDIVPRTPGLMLGYRHTLQEIFLDSFGNVDVSPSVWKKLLSDAWGEWIAVRASHLPEQAITDLIKDHFIESYKQRILQA